MLEKKRHVCLFALAWIFGTVMYCRREGVWPAVLMLIGGVLAYGIATGVRKREQLVVLGLVIGLIFIAFSVCRYQDRSEQVIQNILETDPGTELTGKVVKKEIRSDQYLYYLNTSYKQVIVYYETDEIPVGSEVVVRGKWQAFSHATNEGAFDYAQDYFDRGISFRIFADSVSVEDEPAWSFRETLYQLQKRISEVFSDSLNAREAGVLSQLCVGNKGLMDPDVRELYQDAGLSHILAISGLHISTLGLGIYRFLRRLRVPCHLCEGIGCGVIFCFVLMSGMSVSAIRALVMYMILMGARASGRTYDPLNALSIAALVLLVPNPTNLYRSGFQFSFLAMAAITLFGEVSGRMAEAREENERAAGSLAAQTGIGRANETTGGKRYAGGISDGAQTEKLSGTENGRTEGTLGGSRTWSASLSRSGEKNLPHRILGSLRERLAFTVFLQIAMMPLTAWCYYEVPVYSTFLNLLLLPMCSALLGFGLGGGVMGILFPQAAKWLLIPCHVILRIYEGAVTFVGRLPFSQWITGKPYGWMMLAYYLALVGICALYLVKARENISRLRGDTAGRDLLPEILPGMFCLLRDVCDCLKRHIKLCSFIPLALLASMLSAPGRQFCRIDFLDVGQGDGIYLTDGSGTNVMIDGGSSSESGVGTYEIEPFLKYHGIRKVDAWILTHGDSDHYSGLLEILEDGYRVDYLVLAVAMPKDEVWEELTAAAEANGTEVVYVEAGDAIAMDGCSMTCLFPSAEEGSKDASQDGGGNTDVSSSHSTSDANELSQVWLFENGDMSVLFTGDMGEEQEQLLMERGLITDLAVLKVAHHGSKYSSCSEFLEKVSPEYAVISCGENNIYGHPAPETIERLEDAGCEIYRTPQAGQVTVYEMRGKWKLRTFVH